MFGHDDDGAKTDTGGSDTTQTQIVKPMADTSQPGTGTTSTDPVGDLKTTSMAAPTIIEPTIQEPKITSEKPEPTDGNLLSLGTDPLADADKSSPADSAPAINLPEPTEPAEPASGAPAVPAATSGEELNGLLTIKQDALQQLSPLVDHLDQTPEEKFHTTMMMIQASDDQSLIQKAFEAAKTIADDKERAQALLDIINEINYFTQHQSTEQ